MDTIKSCSHFVLIKDMSGMALVLVLWYSPGTQDNFLTLGTESVRRQAFEAAIN